jgi:hypothetical protein
MVVDVADEVGGRGGLEKKISKGEDLQAERRKQGGRQCI